MSTVRLKEKPILNDQMLRSEHLTFQCGVTSNATPANKQQSSDIPGVSILRTQGQTAAADAIETLAWTAPSDATGLIGVYLSIGTTVTPSLGPVPTMEDYADKVYSVVVQNAATNAVIAATGPGGSAAFLTPLGNIAIEVPSGVNLATTSLTLNVIVNYREQVK